MFSTVFDSKKLNTVGPIENPNNICLRYWSSSLRTHWCLIQTLEFPNLLLILARQQRCNCNFWDLEMRSQNLLLRVKWKINEILVISQILHVVFDAGYSSQTDCKQAAHFFSAFFVSGSAFGKRNSCHQFVKLNDCHEVMQGQPWWCHNGLFRHHFCCTSQEIAFHHNPFFVLGASMAGVYNLFTRFFRTFFCIDPHLQNLSDLGLMFFSDDRGY